MDICFQFLFCIYLGVEFLSHRVILCVTFWGTAVGQIYNFRVHPLLLFITHVPPAMTAPHFPIHVAEDLREPGSWAICGGHQPQAKRASWAGIGEGNHTLILSCLCHPFWLKPKDSFLNNVTAIRVLGFSFKWPSLACGFFTTEPPGKYPSFPS